MDIPLSRYQNLSLDLIQSGCSSTFPHSFKHPKPLFSGYCFFDQRRWRPTPFFNTRCSYVEQVLKPRPVPKPPKTDIETEKKTISEETQIGSLSLGLCAQIEKLALHKRYREALELFEILEGQPDSDVSKSTYDALVTACLSLKSFRGVKRVCNYMFNNGFELDQYMRNRVLLMHVKCGMIMNALNLFEEMPRRNLVSFNTIIGGLVDSGAYEEAFWLFVHLWEEFPNPGHRAIAIMISAAAGLELISAGRQLHSFALKVGIGGNIIVSCSLIDMYGKCGSIEDARCVFDRMPKKTEVAWNAIIASYAFHGYSEKALDMYYEMQDSGVKMDHFTFSIVIRVCARLGSLEHAKQAHAGLVRHGFGSDIVANTTLVDFYSKWGRIEDARNVFEKMPQKNVVSWNALLTGYGNHGRGIEAVELFERMLREGIVPDHVSFLAVLSACSYAGLSDRGWAIFESMSRDHKVKPRGMHYACMIELLGREGRVDDALALIQDAPVPPTVNMWAALLTACRAHERLALGKFAAEKICGMNPEKLSSYAVLLNIYNRSGRLNEASGIVQTLKKRGLSQCRACTWIEIKKQTHLFLSGDTKHIQTTQIYETIDKLMVEISKHGYVPGKKSLLPDVDEKEEQIQSHHSEKLAVAFGLINTTSSTPLQLVQNHLICWDCHDAVKLIAMVTGREIVLRDTSRFHYFKDGKCSCGDYW